MTTEVSAVLLIPAACGLLAVGGIAFGLSVNTASTLGTSEYKCGAPSQVIAETQGDVAVTGASLTVANGTSTRNVQLTFSLDASGTVAGEVVLNWSADGAPVQEFKYGPGVVGSIWSTPDLAGTVVNVDPNVRSGTHTFQAFLRSTTAGNVTISRFCAVGENKSS